MEKVCNFPHLWVILCVVETWMLQFPQEIHMYAKLLARRGYSTVYYAQNNLRALVKLC